MRRILPALWVLACLMLLAGAASVALHRHGDGLTRNAKVTQLIW